MKLESVDKTHLLSWLQGDDLPAATPYEHPFEDIMEALRHVRDFVAVRERIISSATEILRDRPDLSLEIGEANEFELRRRRSVVCNLLRLCVELQAPMQWADLLQAMVDSGQVRGESRGLSLSDALQTAVVVNQKGPELYQRWFGVLNGIESENAYADDVDAAATGAFWMPKSKDEIGRPWIDVIVKALGLAAQQFEKLYPKDPKTWRQRFDVLLAKAKEPYLWSDPDWDLAQGAMKCGWPRWAALRLKLFIVKAAAGGMRIMLSRYLLDSLPAAFERQVASSHPENTVQEVVVPVEAWNFLSAVNKEFEELRRHNPFAGSGADRAALLEALQRIDHSMKSLGVEGDAAAARRQVFAQLGVASSQAYPEFRPLLVAGLASLAEGPFSESEGLFSEDAAVALEAVESAR